MPDYISIRIKPKTKSAILKLSKKWEMKQVDFLQSCMEYFQKTGVNPKDMKVLSPAEELKKFRDTIISFMRKQETDYILPVFGKMDGLIAMFMKYINEEAPRRSDSKGIELGIETKAKKQDDGFEIDTTKIEDQVKSSGEDLSNELEREKDKVRVMKEYFNKVLDHTEYKSTGMAQKHVIELSKGEIKSIRDYLKRI